MRSPGLARHIAASSLGFARLKWTQWCVLSIYKLKCEAIPTSVFCAVHVQRQRQDCQCAEQLAMKIRANIRLRWSRGPALGAMTDRGYDRCDSEPSCNFF